MEDRARLRIDGDLEQAVLAVDRARRPIQQRTIGLSDGSRPKDHVVIGVRKAVPDGVLYTTSPDTGVVAVPVRESIVR